MKALLATGGLGLLAVPAIAILAALGVAGSTITCLETSGGGILRPDAPIPAQAHAWVAETKAACPDLPEAWIAAVMAQESGFRPDAHADDSNGGTWGLFQLNATIWQGAYGHPWAADLNANGIWDVRDGGTHAAVAGKYLCGRLNGVREIRAEHPDWASTALPVLDALIIAHNAGESRLRAYPAIPAVTRGFIDNVHRRVTEWSSVPPTDDVEPDDGSWPAGPTSAPAPDTAHPLRLPGAGCIPALGTSTTAVTVPPSTPHDVDTAVRTALSYVGVTSGWHQLCDRLACRAYGYLSSGYTTATAHWNAMVAGGYSHPGDRCPPLGSFVFFATGRPAGHVSVIVQTSTTCDSDQTLVTSNGVFDRATGNHGGVYLLTLAQLSSGYLNGGGYLGWSEPVCAGAVLAPNTPHPAPSGR